MLDKNVWVWYNSEFWPGATARGQPSLFMQFLCIKIREHYAPFFGLCAVKVIE